MIDVLDWRCCIILYCIEKEYNGDIAVRASSRLWSIKTSDLSFSFLHLSPASGTSLSSSRRPRPLELRAKGKGTAGTVTEYNF